MYINKLYLVYVDGFFEGITNDKYKICDIADNAVNGVSPPLIDDDIPNRVFVEEININKHIKF